MKFIRNKKIISSSANHLELKVCETFSMLALSFLLLFSSFVAFGVMSPKVASATIPKTINFQGKLTNVSNGTNVANGNYTFEFKLYDAPTSGTLLWTETWDGSPSPQCDKLAVTNGVFNAKLGNCNSLSGVDFTTGNLYLSVNFDDGGGFDGEMTPRKQLVSSAFAFVANGVSGDGVINTTNQSTSALAVGRTSTDPALQVDTNTASSVTGLKVTSAAAASGVALSAISSGTNENLTLDGKGTGSVSINSLTGGNVIVGNGSGTFSLQTSNIDISNTGAITDSASYNGLVVTPNTGVITTGTWNGTTIAVANGGTNATTSQGAINNISQLTTEGDLLFHNATDSTRLARGTNGQCLTSTASTIAWGSCTAGGLAWSALTAPTANLSLAHAGYTTDFSFNGVTTANAFSLSSSSLSSGSILNLASTSTAATSNTQTVLKVATSGANATSTQTTYGGYFTNTHTGTSSTNIAGYFSASGGTNNYAAIFENGNVGIGTTSPDAKLRIGNSGTGDGYFKFDIASNLNPTLTLSGDTTNGYYPGIDFMPLGSATVGGSIQAFSLTGGLYLGVRGTGTNGNLYVQNDNSSRTNTVSDILKIVGNTTGTVANGYGVGILLQGESSTTISRDMASIRTRWTDVTDATRTADLGIFTTANATTAERVTITGAGNVGIGTTGPSEKFQVNDGTSLTKLSSTYSLPYVGGMDVTSTEFSNALTVFGKYLFVSSGGPAAGTCSGTTLTGCELRIFDVSKPSSPTPVSGIDLGDNANGVAVAGRYAYVLVDNDTGALNEIRIYDISNIFAPTSVGGVDMGGSSINLSHPIVSGKYLYVGGTVEPSTCSGTNIPGCELKIYDISNPTAPVAVGGYNTNAWIASISLQGRYIYLTTTSNGGNEFSIIDVSNPASPAFTDGVALGTDGVDAKVSGKYAYVTNGNVTGTCSGVTLTGCEFRVYDISDPTNITAVGGADNGDKYSGWLTIVGNYVATANEYNSSGNEIILYDVSDPTAPTVAGGYDLGVASTSLWALVSSGKTLFTAGDAMSGNDVRILNLAGIDTPAINTGTLQANSLRATEDIYAGNNLYASNSLNVGLGGILSGGPVAIQSASTSSSLFALDVKNSAGTSLLAVTDAGAIGIGTTGPGRALEINSATGNNLRLTYNDSNGSATNYADLLTTSAGALTIQPSGFIANIGGGTTRTALRFLEPSGTGTDYVGLQANANVTTSYTWSLPAADSSGCIQSDGSGQLSISACGGGSSAWSSLTAPSGNLTLAHAGNTTTMTFNSVTTGTAWTQSSSSITSGNLYSFGHSSSTFSGNGILMNMANGSGSFTGNFADFQVNGTSKITINSGTETSSGAGAVAGIFEDLTLTNSTASGFQFGNRLLNTVNGSTAGTHVGQFIRMTDSTSLSTGQVVRGLEVQAWSGTNNNGINTGVAAYGKTFGVQATTSGQAGAVSQPAAVFADLDNGSNQTIGNAIRAYTDNATSADLVSFYQETSAYTGNGLIMDFGNNSGSFTGNFISLNKAGTESFHVDDDGSTFVSLTGTQNTVALCHATNGQSNNDEIVDCSGAPSDVAEYFGSTDSTLTPAEVVVSGQSAEQMHLDGYHTSKAWIERATKGYQNNIIGVISTAPAAVYGDEIFTPAENPRPVALVGRVPVKVTLENGPIKAGDFLTSSATEPGKAMKAVRSGVVIGQALSDFDGTGEAVSIVFVNVGFQSIGNTIVLDAPEQPTGTDIQGDNNSLPSTASTFVIQQQTNDVEGSGSSSGTTSQSANILQLQTGDANRFMVSSTGATAILSNLSCSQETPNEDCPSVLKVTQANTELMNIDARGTLTLAGTIIIKDDTFAGSVATDSDGLAEITFSYNLGTGKPVVQLTPEAQIPVFAQILEFKQDEHGNYTGFVIKTFDLISGPVQAIVHYNVTGKQAGYITFGQVQSNPLLMNSGAGEGGSSSAGGSADGSADGSTGGDFVGGDGAGLVIEGGQVVGGGSTSGDNSNSEGGGTVSGANTGSDGSSGNDASLGNGADSGNNPINP